MKKQKAWALVWKDDGRLGEGGVCNNLYDIFFDPKLARNEKRTNRTFHQGLKIVPCTITYSPITKKSTKK